MIPTLRLLIIMTMIILPTTSATAAPIEKGGVIAEMYDRSGYSGQLSFKVNSSQLPEIVLSGGESWKKFAEFNWPSGATVSLSGTFQPTTSWWKSGKKGEVLWKAVELTSLIDPLRDTSVPFSKRVQSFLKAREVFEEKYAEVIQYRLSVEVAPKSNAKDLSEAEERLGYPLPVDYAELLTGLGVLSIEESHFVAPSSLKNAYDQMIEAWGTPSDVMAKLPVETKEFLKKSVILFTEAGDGYGAVIYKPHAGAEGKDGYYWVHQDTITSPELLLKKNGEKRDFTSAFIYAVFGKGLLLYDGNAGNYVYRDSSSPAPLSYQLEAEGEDFSFRLVLDWETLE